jgi:hypothetical protein
MTEADVPGAGTSARISRQPEVAASLQLVAIALVWLIQNIVGAQPRYTTFSGDLVLVFTCRGVRLRLITGLCE